MIINAQQILSGMQFFVELFAEMEALRQQNKQSTEPQKKTESPEQPTETK